MSLGTVYLSRTNKEQKYFYASLQVPYESWELESALEELEAESQDDFFIDDFVCDYNNFTNYTQYDLEELNEIGKRVNELGGYEQDILDTLSEECGDFEIALDKVERYDYDDEDEELD